MGDHNVGKDRAMMVIIWRMMDLLRHSSIESSIMSILWATACNVPVLISFERHIKVPLGKLHAVLHAKAPKYFPIGLA